jgi:hypothetical protein
VAAAGDRLSWRDGGFGRTRYGGVDRDGDGAGDDDAQGLHLGQLSLVARARLAEDLLAHVQVNLDADGGRDDLLGGVGIVEAFGQWSPVLADHARLRLRAGVTIPPFSLEHPEVAWSTRYTITPSAIGSWIGEELKSTGVEGTVTLGLGGSELDLQGAVLSGNDSSGALIAWRGFALHDRQGQIGDDVPLPAVLSLTDERFFPNQRARTEPFHEIDGRPGYHAQARFRIGASGMLQGGWYDSNGDTSVVERSAGGFNYTWDTRFYVVGGQLDAGPVNLVGQWMDGTTEMGFEDPKRVDAPFRAGYLLVSLRHDASRFSFRYDHFEVEDEDTWLADKDLNTEDGWAATAAFIQGFGERHRLEVEVIRYEVDHPFAITAGDEPRQEEFQFQAGWRLTI